MSSFNIGDFNNFLSQANNLITCDETCQRNKKENALRESVLDAENNLATAPSQVEASNKEYIIYTKGAAVYSQGVEERFTTEAQANSQRFSRDFITATENTITSINTYEGLLNNVSNVEDYYNSLIEQNKTMTIELKKKFSDVVTNDRKTFYENQKIESLYFYYKILLFFYFIACVSLAVSIIVRPSDIGRKTKIVMLIAFIVYPFVCTRLFLLLGTLYDNIVSLLPKNVYKNPDITYSPNQE